MRNETLYFLLVLDVTFSEFQRCNLGLTPLLGGEDGCGRVMNTGRNSWSTPMYEVAATSGGDKPMEAHSSRANHTSTEHANIIYMQQGHHGSVETLERSLARVSRQNAIQISSPKSRNNG
jgi:hypothetical protein